MDVADLEIEGDGIPMELITLYHDDPIVVKRATDIAKPIGAAKDTALFYVHGGGWSAGARDAFHPHLEHFSKLGYWCASVGYRLAPGAKWHEQLADIMDGYDRFIRYLEQSGAEIRKIVVLGSSAGAHLVSLLAQMGPEDAARVGSTLRLTGPWRKPDACVSINGPGTLELWPDMNEEIKTSIEKVIGASYEDTTDKFALASPDRYVKEGGPDFLFLVVEHEKYFPHEYVYRMSKQIQELGGTSEVVYFADAQHGFFYGVSSAMQKKAMAVLEPFVAGL